jgi:putative ABC transport system permease protein
VERSVAAAIRESDPDLTFSFRELVEQVGASIAQDRILAILSAFFGALALTLAGLGLYGVTAYAVTRRRTEIAIRMAIGATPNSAIRLILGNLFARLGFGLMFGLSVSLWASRFVGSLLYDVAPRDPLVLVVATLAFIVVAALAGIVPACRASRIEPARILEDS